MNPQEAEAALRKALELEPRNNSAHIELGSLYEDQDKLIEAAAEFERAIAIEPNHGGEHCQLGRICRKQGRWPEAEAALRKALALDPQNGWAHIELGTLYRGQDRFSEAAAEFEKAIAIDGNQGWIYFQLGQSYRGQGRASEAEAALRKALEFDPRDGGAHMELGALYQEQDRFPEAVAEYERAIAIEPNYGGSHCRLGRIYLRQGRWPEAEAALRKAVELDPQDGGARIDLGTLYQGQDRFPEAAAEFERAIAVEPNHGGAQGQLGRIYRKQGRWPEAEAAMRKALELEPQHGGVRFELGALYAVQGKFAQATAEFETGLAIEPNHGGAHFELGNVYRRQGRWREAELEFKETIAIEPKNDRTYMGLWAIYRSQGRLAEAEAAARRASALNAKHGWACADSPPPCDPGRSAGARPPVDGRRVAVCTREQVFCILPWVHLHLLVDGHLRPCCSWRDEFSGNARVSPLSGLWNSLAMKALRLDMLGGRPVLGCQNCYDSERVGFWSVRQIMNDIFSHHLDRLRLTAPDGTLPRLSVPFIDIRFSNVCNLRCRICNTQLSTALAEEARASSGSSAEGSPVQRPYADWEAFWRQLQPILEDGLEEISFVGGEPLIMEEHYRILDFLIARKLTHVRLRYNTNFSTLRFQGRDVIDLWSRFRNVHVAASLDGSGRRGEYIRKGLRWDAVVANREEMLRRCPEVKFSILATLSIFNALHLPDFHREWVEKGYVDRDMFGLNMLVVPEIYRMQALPAVLKHQVLESYRRHRESFLDADGRAAHDFTAAAHFMEAQDRSELLPEFVAMTRRLDRLRGEACREVFPELAGLFEAAE